MPRYKNRFSAPTHIEEIILDENNNTVGTIRVKPSSILWKPVGQRKFYAVPLDKFTSWIVSTTAKASRVKS